jgi:hypothetical protein
LTATAAAAAGILAYATVGSDMQAEGTAQTAEGKIEEPERRRSGDAGLT